MDVIKLVCEGVVPELDAGDNDDDCVVRAYSKERRRAMDTWKTLPHPLGYTHQSYTHLVNAISINTQHLGNELPLSHQGQKSISWFADQVLDFVTQPGAHILPPMWKSGHGYYVFKICLQEAEKLLGSTIDDTTTCATISGLLAKSASLMHIFNIPWSPNPLGVAGRPITTITHKT